VSYALAHVGVDQEQASNCKVCIRMQRHCVGLPQDLTPKRALVKRGHNLTGKQSQPEHNNFPLVSSFSSPLLLHMAYGTSNTFFGSRAAASLVIMAESRRPFFFVLTFCSAVTGALSLNVYVSTREWNQAAVTGTKKLCRPSTAGSVSSLVMTCCPAEDSRTTAT